MQRYLQQKLVAMLEESISEDPASVQAPLATKLIQLVEQLDPRCSNVATSLPRRQLSITGPVDSEVGTGKGIDVQSYYLSPSVCTGVFEYHSDCRLLPLIH